MFLRMHKADICAAKDFRFGNGRLARNCFEQSVSRQADHVAYYPVAAPDVIALTCHAP